MKVFLFMILFRDLGFFICWSFILDDGWSLRLSIVFVLQFGVSREEVEGKQFFVFYGCIF